MNDIPPVNAPAVIDKESIEKTNASKATELTKESNESETSEIFPDPHDITKYKWVLLLDDKKWMAENLNYETPTSKSYCFKCKNYGRLYTWQAAKKACPKGSRLPTYDEWRKMISYYGNVDSSSKKNRGKIAEKAAYKTLMENGSSGFSAMLGGQRHHNGNFGEFDLNGYYWTSTEYKKNTPYRWAYYFDSSDETIRQDYISKDMALSCRCIQD